MFQLTNSSPTETRNSFYHSDKDQRKYKSQCLSHKPDGQINTVPQDTYLPHHSKSKYYKRRRAGEIRRGRERKQEREESGRLARRRQKADEMHCGCRSPTPVLPRHSKALKIGGVRHHCSTARVTWSFLQPASGRIH